MSSRLLFEFHQRFRVVRANTSLERSLFFVDCLSPATIQTVKGCDFSLDNKGDRLFAYRLFLPMRIGLSSLLKVKAKPSSRVDAQFWQYPAITEKIASEKHVRVVCGKKTSYVPVQAYLGLPWATYIDKKSTLPIVLSALDTRLLGYRLLAREWKLRWGEDVRVHTVCQHVEWQRMLLLWKAFGVTDVHLSHCEFSSGDIAYNYGIRVHSWPLAAANIVDVKRRKGLFFEKQIRDKKYLASFIGSYLPNHRSDVRLRIRAEAVRDGGKDLCFSLKREWHFNSIVYREQVQNRPLNTTQIFEERCSTEYYNSILSDSIFSICPEGSGPNTIRLWESLAVGSIPVVIVENWVWPSIPDDKLSWKDCVIHIPRKDIHGLFHRLRQMKKNELDKLIKMQVAAMSVYKAFHRKRCF